jgi:hypothetical protein
MTSLALIINPRSRRNHGTTTSECGHPFPAAQPSTREELVAALKQFASRGIRTVAINGGDGTVREVVSVLPEIYGREGMPAVAILPSGYTNVIAADVGTPGHGEQGLVRLLAALNGDGPALRIVERPSLEVRRPGQDIPVLRGFFFGAAAFTHATREFFRQRRLEPVAGTAAVGLFMGASLLRAFLPGRRRALWLAGEPMSVSVDGRNGPQADRHFLVLATTLRRLVFRLWPFWGADAAGLRWLDIDAPPSRLLRAAGRILRGRSEPWMLAAGYRSGSAAHLNIDLKAPFILDGELFEAGEAGIELSLGPPVRFLAP